MTASHSGLRAKRVCRTSAGERRKRSTGAVLDAVRRAQLALLALGPCCASVSYRSPVDEEGIELGPLDGEAAARSVTLEQACDALGEVAARGVPGLSPSQAEGLAGDLRAVLWGYAEEARERGEPQAVSLAELREMLADVL